MPHRFAPPRPFCGCVSPKLLYSKGYRVRTSAALILSLLSMLSSRFSPLTIGIIVLAVLGIGIYLFAPKDAVAPDETIVATSTLDGSEASTLPETKAGDTAPVSNNTVTKPAPSATEKPAAPAKPAPTPATQSTAKAAYKNEDPNIPACPAGRPVFGVVPMSESDFYALRPLGFIAVPDHIFGAPHMAFSVNLPGEKKVNRPIVFPADAAVTEIAATTRAGGVTEYSVTFWPCPTFKATISHVGELSDKLTTAYANAAKSCAGERCIAKLSYPVKAADRLGVNDGTATVDFRATDYARAPYKFANASRYDLDFQYAVPAYDYFAPSIQSGLGKRVGSADGMAERTVLPKGGTLAQDVAGTAQGNWFSHDGSITKPAGFDQHIQLGHDYIDPTTPVIAIGRATKGVSMGLYTFPVQPTGNINRDFKHVIPGAIYCYERFNAGRTAGRLTLAGLDGVLLVRMPNENVLFVEQQASAGATCQTVAPWKMTDHATIYER